MPSYTWSTRFREGQWRAFRKFILEERRDVDSRISTLMAEIDRIGDIYIGWAVDGDGLRTEERVSFAVTPSNSSLGKLVQAYTAMGGNPFDISAFVGPDQNFESDDTENPISSPVPKGGVLHLEDITYSPDSGATDGDANFLKYKPSRSGGNNVDDQAPQIWEKIRKMRGWATQEMRYKRTRIEEQVIKLCDLREQLEGELDDIAWAMAGDLPPEVGYDPERFNERLSAGFVAYYFDAIFRVPDPETYSVAPDDSAVEGQPGSVNNNNLAQYPTLMTDEADEKNTAL